MPRFVWTHGALHVSIAAFVLLVAGVLMAVSSSSAWGEVSGNGARIDVYLSEGRIVAPGFGSFGLEWSSEQFDDADGIGLVRVGSILALVGTISVFVSMAVVGFAVALRHIHFATLGSILAAVSFMVALAGLILFPIGAEQVWDWFRDEGDGGQASQQEDIDWGAGLVLGVIATTFALGGTIAGFTALRHPDVT